jgi:hypothetical protein
LDWAVCCSSGGIRSATYCLGALQSLDEGGLLGEAKWIVGVSGGSYIAASRALVAHSLDQLGEPHAYARGTDEEEHLRNNTHHLKPPRASVLAGALAVLLGTMITFVLVVAPLYVLTHAWGWLLRWQGVLAPSGPRVMTAVATGLVWRLPSIIAAGITVALLVFWRASLKSGGPDRGVKRAKWVGWAAAFTAGVAIAMLAMPPLISWLTRGKGLPGTIAHFVGLDARPSWSLLWWAGLVAVVTVVGWFSYAGLAKWNVLDGAPAPGGATRTLRVLLTRLTRWLRLHLLPWMAGAAIVLGGVVLALRWTSDGARAGLSVAQFLPVIVALAVMLATRVAVDFNGLSLHDFYRWRLADAYAVTRRAVQATRSEHRDQLLAQAARTRLSQLRTGDGTPDLVIACTANINAHRAVPAGRGGYCLAFDPKQVTLRGNPHGSDPEVRARTEDYEYLLGHTRFTLFDVVAISGAAFSPLMGAATRGAYRILLTFTNLRLGIWMPHPEVVRRARAYLDTRPELRQDDSWWTGSTLLLLAWYVGRHPFWHRDPGRRRKAEDREARLWAHVLDLRERSTRSAGWAHFSTRLRAAVWWRVMQPTLGMLWAEAVGHTSYRATWVNVTDGGHYDNLGLVEALRRGARNVVVLDASGDRPDTWFTLGGAMALARADAGVDISLDPTVMANGNGRGTPARLGKGQVLQPWAHGSFVWHGGPAVDGQRPAAPRADGMIWICKLGCWDGAPWDVRAYAKGHPTYPSDKAQEQLYDAAEFDAYRQLGVATVREAAQHGMPPLPLLSPLQP